MKKTLGAFALLAFVMAAALALSACSESGKVTLKVYNWGDYIAENVIEDFEKEYSIKVIYNTYDDNEKLYTKVKNSGSNNYDVIVPSDYMVRQMIEEDMLLKLDKSKMPNYEYIDESFRDLSYDPGNEYSVPYMWGITGILYNEKLTGGPIDSWDALFDPKFSQKIFMLESMRDSIGIALKKLGYSMNSTNPSEIEKARDLLLEQKPLVLGYVTDEVKDKMIAGEGALALVYGGEGIKAAQESNDLKFVIPREGGNLAVDALAILKTTKHPEEAMKFIDFLCRPDIALRNAIETGYSTPNKAAKEQLPDEIKNDPGRYPPKEVLDRCEVFDYIPEAIDKYSEAWTRIKSK